MQAVRVGDLAAIRRGQIESVDCALTISGDMGGMNGHLRVEQGPGQRIEQRRPVEGSDFNDGQALRGLIVGIDLRHDRKGFLAPARQRPAGQPAAQMLGCGNSVVDALPQPLQLRGFGEWFAQRALHDQIVERHAVHGGVDAGIHHRSAGQRDAAGNAIEQPRLVGGIDRDQRGSAAVMDMGGHGDFPPFAIGLLHQAQVAGSDFRRLGDPVAVGEAAGEGVNDIVAFPGQPLQFGLGAVDARLAHLVLVPEAQHFLDRIIERGQQLGLPAVPHAGADRRDVDHGQHQQQPQPFRRSNHPRHILNGLRVGQVALEGDRRQQQMLLHQPGHGIGFRSRQPEARPQPPGNAGAQRAVVAAAALGDIVQQHGDIEHPARHQLADDGRSQRQFLTQVAAFGFRQQVDGADGVLVNGVMVIHVPLHAGVDAAEIRNEAAEHAGFVHGVQDSGRVARRGQHIEEQRIGARIFAHGTLDQPRIARSETHGHRVNRQLLAVGKLEQFDQPHRVFGKELFIGRFDLAARQQEPVEPRRPAAQARQPAARMLFLQMGEEHSGQIADLLGGQEIMPHEAFDRAHAGAVGIGHAVGDFALHVEGQPLFGAAGDVVQIDPHGPEKIPRPLEQAIFRRREQPFPDQIRRILHLVHEFADPEQCLQVAQSALAVLDIGFDDIAAVAHALVSFIAFGQLFGDEFAGMASYDFLLKAVERFIIELPVAPQIARFEQRRAHAEVGFGQADGVLGRARRIADLEVEIP